MYGSCIFTCMSVCETYFQRMSVSQNILFTIQYIIYYIYFFIYYNIYKTNILYTQCYFISSQALHAANLTTVINFLPTLLNQLFRLLPSTANDEVAFESVRSVCVLLLLLHSVRKQICSNMINFISSLKMSLN